MLLILITRLQRYFNTSYVVVQHLGKSVSNSQIVFQYILCCGSTFLFFPTALSFQYFNTSYVVVQQMEHLRNETLSMDFNTSYVVVQLRKNNLLESGIYEFQYILCCGSTTFLLFVERCIKISIHLMLWFNMRKLLSFLDLSEISIHLMLWFNLWKKASFFFEIRISIHLMLWFNHCWYVIAIFYYTEVLLK